MGRLRNSFAAAADHALILQADEDLKLSKHLKEIAEEWHYPLRPQNFIDGEAPQGGLGSQAGNGQGHLSRKYQIPGIHQVQIAKGLARGGGQAHRHSGQFRRVVGRVAHNAHGAVYKIRQRTIAFMRPLNGRARGAWPLNPSPCVQGLLGAGDQVLRSRKAEFQGAAH